MFNNMTHSAITDLFHEAPTRFLTNEISIFKTKYNQMVLDEKLNRAPFVTPDDGDNENSEALNNFIYSYIDDLNEDRREAIINTYGVSNAMDLLYIFHYKCLENPKDLHFSVESYHELKLIELMVIMLILRDAIGAYMEWKYLPLND